MLLVVAIERGSPKIVRVFGVPRYFSACIVFLRVEKVGKHWIKDKNLIFYKIKQKYTVNNTHNAHTIQKDK